MTTEGVETAPEQSEGKSAIESETERARRRSLSSLLEVSRRLASLGTLMSDGKTAAELAAMSAWVSAFGCQLAGAPIELAPMPKGELLLVSIELEPHTDRLCSAHTFMPSEQLHIHQDDAASSAAAFSLALVRLAHHVLEGAADRLPRGSEVDARHRRAEEKLVLRLESVVHAYDEDVEEPDAPSVNAHGMPPEE